MKKILLMVLVCGLLFVSSAFAGGGKNQGDVGQGSTMTNQDPAPFEWPGIDW